MSDVAWIALAALSVTVISHLVVAVFWAGTMQQRLKGMEGAVHDAVNVGRVISGLTESVAGLKAAVDRLDRAVEKINDRVLVREP